MLSFSSVKNSFALQDQKSANAIKKQLSDPSNKIDHTLQPVFKSRKYAKTSKCASQNHI